MDRIEKLILSLIDENRNRIVSFAEDVRLHPESGFKECRTASKLADLFRGMDLPTEEGLAITGVRAVLGVLDTKIGASVVICGELDGVRCDRHPEADPVTGIAHACGHHAQLGAMAGAAFALSNPEVAAVLDGIVTFLGVPAEEGMEGDLKRQLQKDGKIRMMSGGKAELIHLGVFDGMDAVLASHAHFSETGADLLIGNGSTNGYTAKTITVRGKAAHAGSKPHEGINALNAASLGLTALAYHRETFRDEDAVRIHGVITKGGGAVNVVPDEVTIEVMVRGKNLAAISDAGMKTDRSFKAAAMALGAQAEIANLPGYLPVIASPPEKVQWLAAAALSEAYESGINVPASGHSLISQPGESTIEDPLGQIHAKPAIPHPITISAVDPGLHNPLSTDVGDLTHLLPVLHVTSGGYVGSLHGADFRIFDDETAIIMPAKLMALTTYHLLKNGAAEARSLREKFKPALTKDAYLALMGLSEPETGSDFEPQGSDFEPQGSDFEPHGLDFESQGSDFEPQGSDFEP